MKKSTRLLALLLAAGLSIGAGVMTAAADDNAPAEQTVLVDECFDDYDDKYDAKSTLLFPTFMIDANSIGEGYVQVQENPDTGNLHLKSHVFTQVYTAEPIKGAYTFSMDVFQTQGNRNCAIFLRAPMCGENAFYEKDGSEDGNAACRTGVVVNAHHTSIDVNIKSYSAKAGATSFLVQNIFTFDLPEGVTLGQQAYTNFKVVDTGTEMSIYVANTLLCRIAFSEPGSGYARAEISENCFRKAVLYDAEGSEMATVDSPLVQCDGATVGWATRVADMIVDNVYLATGESGGTEETQPTETQPAETVAPETLPESEAETVAATLPESETISESGKIDETVDDTSADTAAGSETVSVTEDDTTVDGEGCVSTVAAGGLVALLGAAFVTLKKKH